NRCRKPSRKRRLRRRSRGESRMTLDELKILLGIPSDDTSKDDLLKILLPAAIDFVVEWTRNPFSQDEKGEIVLPSGVKLAISMMIQAALAAGIGTEGAA